RSRLHAVAPDAAAAVARGVALERPDRGARDRHALGVRRPLPEHLRRLTYDGPPVHGYGTTQRGAPTDGFGRLIYLDTYNSVYGEGWRRENSFVAHNP